MSSVLDRECPQMSTNASVCWRRTAYSAYDQRMTACLKRIQPMSNLPLAYVSVYQRMSENVIRNSYVSLTRSSVTGPLGCVVLILFIKSGIRITVW